MGPIPSSNKSLDIALSNAHTWTLDDVHLAVGDSIDFSAYVPMFDKCVYMCILDL